MDCWLLNFNLNYTKILDFIWLHVRAAGGWTNKLYDYFERERARVCSEKFAAEGRPPCVRCLQKLEALDSSKGTSSR